MNRVTKDQSPENQLTGFIGKYTPEIGVLAQAVLAKMRARLPGAVELVYDNYNALVIGFGPTERTSDAIFSVALYPRWVTLFFLQGAGLADPQGLLKGSGKIVRHIALKDAATLDEPAVQALIASALDDADAPFDTATDGRIVIKSISAKQRPRRPAQGKAPKRKN
jgi:hypothetical protein